MSLDTGIARGVVYFHNALLQKTLRQRPAIDFVLQIVSRLAEILH
jgi:hypothetical protein